jgi:hypothetical protein
MNLDAGGPVLLLERALNRHGRTNRIRSVLEGGQDAVAFPPQLNDPSTVLVDLFDHNPVVQFERFFREALGDSPSLRGSLDISHQKGDYSVGQFGRWRWVLLTRCSHDVVPAILNLNLRMR